MNDADVVCRSLGLGHAQMIPITNISDDGLAGVTLDRVHCTGNESTFFDCPGVGNVSESDCGDSGDARVLCSGGKCFLSTQAYS